MPKQHGVLSLYHNELILDGTQQRTIYLPRSIKTLIFDDMASTEMMKSAGDSTALKRVHIFTFGWYTGSVGDDGS